MGFNEIELALDGKVRVRRRTKRGEQDRERGELGAISHVQFRFNQPGVQRYVDSGSSWILSKKTAGGVGASENVKLASLVAKAVSEKTDHHLLVGKDVTPFLLARMEKLTEGKSLAANAALIRNNAGVAAKIAVAYSALRAADG